MAARSPAAASKLRGAGFPALLVALAAILIFMAKIQASIDRLQTNVEGLRADVEGLRADVEVLRADFKEVAEAVTTRRVALAVEAVASASVVSVHVQFQDVNHTINTCSGFPLPTPILVHAEAVRLNHTNTSAGTPPLSLSSSRFFVSAGHCFVVLVPETGAIAERSADGVATITHNPTSDATYNCIRVLDFYSSSKALDLAVIKCTEPVPTPPLALFSASSPITYMPVALAGFSSGLRFFDKSTEPSSGLVLHTTFSRVVSSLRTPPPSSAHRGLASAESAAPGSNGTSDESHKVISDGAVAFVANSPLGGESGGPVLSMDGSVVGMSVSRSLNTEGGIFLRFTPELQAELATSLAGLPPLAGGQDEPPRAADDQARVSVDPQGEAKAV